MKTHSKEVLILVSDWKRFYGWNGLCQAIKTKNTKNNKGMYASMHRYINLLMIKHSLIGTSTNIKLKEIHLHIYTNTHI